jgi:H+-transporting ATPase
MIFNFFLNQINRFKIEKTKYLFMDLEIGVEEVKKISTSELLDRLSSDLKGLSEGDAEARLKYGINEISEGQQNHLKKFLGYFWGSIPWMIEFALIISLLIRHWPEFSIILLLLLINGLVGFFQEDRADNAIELLKEKLAYKARVLREINGLISILKILCLMILLKFILEI